MSLRIRELDFKKPQADIEATEIIFFGREKRYEATLYERELRVQLYSNN